MKMNRHDKLKAHTIILSTFVPVGIFTTYDMAVRFCESLYGEDWEKKSVTIEKTTPEHIKEIIKG